MIIKHLILLTSIGVGMTSLSGNGTELRIGSFDSGGGRSESSGTVVHGVVGAPMAGISTGGNVSLASGFPATLEIDLPEGGESFANWMETLPFPHQPPVAQRGPLDMPAGDGMSNLLKYALGLMPMTPSAGAAPRIVLIPFTDSITGFKWHWMGLEFRSAPTAAVDFAVAHGGNLTGWQLVSSSKETLGNPDSEGRHLIRIKTTVIAENHDRHFLRLIVRMD